MTASVAVSPRCIYPKTCGWRIEGPGADKSAEEHAKAGHATVTEAIPE